MPIWVKASKPLFMGTKDSMVRLASSKLLKIGASLRDLGKSDEQPAKPHAHSSKHALVRHRVKARIGNR
jgi:hypothetical protein